jgi:hypothetical protein
MKKVLIVCAAMVATIALAPPASANSLEVLYSPALTAPTMTGTIANNVDVYVSNVGTFDETETFINTNKFAVDNISVSLDSPSFIDHSNDGQAPGGGNPNDIVTAVSILSDLCSGADLTTSGPGDSCSIELQFSVTAAAPFGTGDDALSYGNSKILLAVAGTDAKNSDNIPKATGEFVATVNYVPSDPPPLFSSSPEPGSLVLLGSGFGVLGLGVFLRRRYAAAHPTAF